MIHFVGAGPGAPDLITVRGQRLVRQADVIVYAGSLVNEEILKEAKAGCAIYNSASMTLEEVLEVLLKAERTGRSAVRLHTGDPCLYGAIREQMDALEREGIEYDYTPGVSSFCAAAAALEAEYTLPGVSQTVIITRLAGRTPVPQAENLESLAAHRASMVIFLSAKETGEVCRQLIEGGYPPDTPAAIVYKASWPQEKTVRGTLDTLPALAAQEGIEKTALITVGGFLGGEYERSKLYDPSFSHGCRQAQKD
ncbi:precorrin-4 C(11)-methyltransferase [Harryflintia acetispora]|uniref:Cobalt-precorrin 4 C11-methyltransferase n=1 Tax=Harryflintia acetispora TaxID=1849041 RepID=A0A9X8UII7_9FIRM|nr:precorrin-4 C(11)-methyltransferase [Harryflintia acetispora]TCL42303.1 cobalt-precorrin 4 C11-methyltransferase [Harryflintia acetispora]